MTASEQKRIAHDWIKHADRLTIIGKAPERHEPVYVTMIVSGPPPVFPEIEDEGDGREPDGQRMEGGRIIPTDR